MFKNVVIMRFMFHHNRYVVRDIHRAINLVPDLFEPDRIPWVMLLFHASPVQKLLLRIKTLQFDRIDRSFANRPDGSEDLAVGQSNDFTKSIGFLKRGFDPVLTRFQLSRVKFQGVELPVFNRLSPRNGIGHDQNYPAAHLPAF